MPSSVLRWHFHASTLPSVSIGIASSNTLAALLCIWSPLIPIIRLTSNSWKAARTIASKKSTCIWLLPMWSNHNLQPAPPIPSEKALLPRLPWTVRFPPMVRSWLVESLRSFLRIASQSVLFGARLLAIVALSAIPAAIFSVPKRRYFPNLFSASSTEILVCVWPKAPSPLYAAVMVSLRNAIIASAVVTPHDSA